MSVLVNTPYHRTRCLNFEQSLMVKDLKFFLADFEDIPLNDLVILCNGVILQDNLQINNNNIYQVFPRIRGGKGGFGSMLRAIGAQIEKTTNREACRDLSGRRLRDINDEKRLKKWIAKQADRERESERHRKERLERRLEMPRFEFRDPAYEAERRAIPEKVGEAVYQGLNKTEKASSSKRKADSIEKNKNKKSCLWIAADLDSDTSDSNESETRETAQCWQYNPSENSFITGNTDNETLSYELASSSKSTENIISENVSNSKKQNYIPLKTSMHVDGDIFQENEQNSSLNKDELCHFPSQMPLIINSNDYNSIDNSCASSLRSPLTKSSAIHYSIPTKPQMSTQIPESDKKQDQGIASEDFQTLNLNNYHCVEDLEALGLERLKLALLFLGLKCGGTLQERARRLFSVKDLQPCDIDPSLLARPNKK